MPPDAHDMKEAFYAVLRVVALFLIIQDFSRIGVVNAANSEFGGITEVGQASWYDSKSACGPKTNNAKGCPTASGKGLYELEAKGTEFAASNDFKLGTRVRVCNQENSRCTDAIILDRGGFAKYGRKIDLCKKAFGKIADVKEGVIEVTITPIKGI